MKKLALALLPAVVLATLAQPALAKDYPDGGVTGDEVLTDLTATGDTGTLTKDSTGDPMIKAAFKVGDTAINYLVLFYGCKQGRCTSLQFAVSFDGDTSKITAYNNDKRFGRAAILEGKTIRVTYDVDVEKGANSAAIQNCVNRFAAVVIDAVRTIG